MGNFIFVGILHLAPFVDMDNSVFIPKGIVFVELNASLYNVRDE